MAPDRKDLQRSFLQLLRQANLDRYEALLELGPIRARQRLDQTNQDYGTFEALPDPGIVDWLLREAQRRGLGLGPVLLDHLPDEEGFWRGARANISRSLEIEGYGSELPGDDDFRPWRSMDELPGEEDFRPWSRPDSDTDKD